MYSGLWDLRRRKFGPSYFCNVFMIIPAVKSMILRGRVIYLYTSHIFLYIHAFFQNLIHYYIVDTRYI